VSALILRDALRHHVQMAKQRHFLKAWRKHRDLTQEQLAERIGCDQSLVSKVERYKHPYDQAYIEAAAEALNVEVVDLLIRDPSDPDGLWSIMDGLKPAQRVQLVEIGKTIKRTGT